MVSGFDVPFLKPIHCSIVPFFLILANHFPVGVFRWLKPYKSWFNWHFGVAQFPSLHDPPGTLESSAAPRCARAAQGESPHAPWKVAWYCAQGMGSSYLWIDGEFQKWVSQKQMVYSL